MVAFTITAARNLAAALLVMACVGGGVATAQTTTTAASGDTVTIGVGSRDGVRVGMTGRITKQEMVGGQLQSFEIARFEVTQVEASSCTARLTAVGSGWVVGSGMEVAFDQPLAPPRVNTATIVIRSNVAGDVAYLDGRRLGPTPQRVDVAPGEHTVRVEKDGWQAGEKRVKVSAGQETVVRVELVAQPLRPPGLPGMLVEELQVEGIIHTPSGILAFVLGRDNVSYIIRPGTKLYDGRVREILPDRVIFERRLGDPEQTLPYEEVVKEPVK